jgi:hypothetical protein
MVSFSAVSFPNSPVVFASFCYGCGDFWGVKRFSGAVYFHDWAEKAFHFSL